MTTYLVAGPPAVGKSTVTRVLAESLPRSVLVDVDRIRDGMVVSGGVLPGGEGWPPELIEQLAASRASACAISRVYASIGFDVVIDDFYDPYSRLSEYAAIADLAPKRVLLLPDRGVAVARSRLRGQDAAEFIAAGIAEVYAAIPHADQLAADGWTVLDNTGDSPEQTRDRILAIS